MSDTHSAPPLFDAAPWLLVTATDLGPARNVPTMLHMHEQKLYYWLTKNQIGGPGAVVDLGAFVGGSTARLAQGMQDAGSSDTLHTYDRFTVDPRAKAKFLYAEGIEEFEGNNMLPVAQCLLAPWQNRLQFHVGQIEDLGWDVENGPIAILALDACKSPDLTDYIARTFYPSLIAGQSVINHQDFLQWDQFWLPPHMMLMADFFEPLAFVKGTSVLYRCVRVPNVADINERRVDVLDDQQMIEMLQDSKRRFKGWGMGKHFQRMIATIVENPGQRVHWKLKNPGKR